MGFKICQSSLKHFLRIQWIRKHFYQLKSIIKYFRGSQSIEKYFKKFHSIRMRIASNFEIYQKTSRDSGKFLWFQKKDFNGFQNILRNNANLLNI